MDDNAKQEADEAAAKAKEKEGTEEMVPKSRLEDAHAKLAASEESKDLIAQQNALIIAQQQNASPKGEAYDIFKELGVDGDDDVLTVDQQRKLHAFQMQQVGAVIKDLQFQVAHPDFSEICGTPEQIRLGQWAQPLKDAIKRNPALMPTILSSPNPKEAAYQIAKMHLAKPGAKVEADEAAKAIEEAAKAAGKIKSASNVSAGAPLSEEGRYGDMSDEEFLEIAAKNGAIF